MVRWSGSSVVSTLELDSDSLDKEPDMLTRLLTPALCALIAVLSGSMAGAASISVLPSASSVVEGSSIAVDLTIEGLGAGAAPSVGVFDIEVSFDPTIVGLGSVTYGDQLDLAGFGSIQATTEIAPGRSNLFELSLDPAALLDSSQAGSFVLATIVFDALTLGTTEIDLDVNVLGDSRGAPIAYTTTSGTLTVEAIPEPGAALLFGLGSALFAVRLKGS